MTTEAATKAINSYVTDMLALEKHIQKAIAGQIEDLDEEDPGFVGELRGINATIERHIASLEELAERREGGGQRVSDAVKRAASNILGAGAALVDFVRTESLPKNLRDDYTAMSLASIGYVMLYTTATSLDDAEVASLAHSHFRDHAGAVMRLNDIIPASVVRFLQKDGLPARSDVLGEVNQAIEAVWRSEPGSASGDDATSRRRSGTADVRWDRAVGDRGTDAELR